MFDIGGVLLEWDPGLVYRTLIPDEGDRLRFLREVCTPEWNAEVDAGRSIDEACEELATRHPSSADWVHAWKRQDEMIAGEVAGMRSIVSALHRRVRLYLLTNMPAAVFAARRERFELLQLFDGAVVSGEEGVLKPERVIFTRLTERFDLDPSRTLFVDDLAGNVAGASDAGFVVHRFAGAGPLRLELAELGLAL